ncbi:MAG: UvrD-helicase domain-containing protein, partial [Clostridia bacterium]|nr:UvrD-helicase domain-containing protein [Clostridia bacterium]
MCAKLDFTPSQKDAINICDHTLLVSAAAGSGKTAVLTQKIIKLVTDRESEVNVSDLLVVTFTKAAATELKERISTAIYNALKENPSDKHLSKQLMLLGKSKISTIHSFCSGLIKTNFQVLGLPSSLRIGDETETGLICDTELNNLIEECYSGLHTDRISRFDLLSESFMTGKNDSNLSLDFKKLYKYLCNYPEGIELLKNSSADFLSAADGPVLDNKWGQVVKKNLTRVFEYYRAKFQGACDAFLLDEVYAKELYPGFEESLKYCERVLALIGNASYDEIKSALGEYTSSKLGGLSQDEKNATTEYYRAIRNAFKGQVSKICSSCFAFSENFVKEQFKILAEINNQMYNFFSVFEKRYSEEKLKRGLLDYNDLERLTLKLLYKDNACTVLTEFAYNIQKNYKYVFIDEYQDVNELQDRIFSAISMSNNRFMVGDIKQSIYGFRGAEPSLFSGYRQQFPEYKKESVDSDGLTIFLSNNFRSNHSVIDFSNAVFKVLFNNNSGKSPYREGDRLICSRIYDPDEIEYQTKMYCLEEAEDDGIKGFVKEAEFVASEIEKLIKDGKEPSDIAVLLRSRKNAAVYEEALKKRNISSYNNESRGIFENDAVLLMVCLLNAIDNPSRDVYLAGVLKSPLFNFSLSELTEIRQIYRYCTLFDAVRKYASEQKSEKAQFFLDKLNEWRRFAEGSPVDKIIRHIYDETHIVELLAGKKESEMDIVRQANLLLLYEYARQFENGSFKGLYNFILYINDVLDGKTELANAKVVSEGNGVVNIMTIHNSKGLEFDTVFLCDTGKQLNRDNEKKYYALRKDLGLTMVLRDSTSFAKYKTMAKYSADILGREDALDEELRVLYVALTRAKKRLIITSSISKARQKIEQISMPESFVSQQSLMSAQTLIELILWGILKSDYKDYSIDYYSGKCEVSETEEAVEEKTYDEQLIKEYTEIIEERLGFVYPESEFTKMPTKLSVSKL